MGIPALEDGLFANLLIFDYVCVSLFGERIVEGLKALGRFSYFVS